MPEFLLLGVVLILLLGAYWSMVIFPRQRAFQQRQKFARALGVGDEVVTYGGIIGHIQKVDADKGVAYVEIADGVVVRFLTASLVHSYDAEEFGKAARIGLEENSQAHTTRE